MNEENYIEFLERIIDTLLSVIKEKNYTYMYTPWYTTTTMYNDST